jgi:diaminopimelate epimerase
VLAAATWTRVRLPASYRVEVAGGQLRVDLADGGAVQLTGPAVLVADGELRHDWLEQSGRAFRSLVGPLPES